MVSGGVLEGWVSEEGGEHCCTLFGFVCKIFYVGTEGEFAIKCDSEVLCFVGVGECVIEQCEWG